MAQKREMMAVPAIKFPNVGSNDDLANESVLLPTGFINGGVGVIGYRSSLEQNRFSPFPRQVKIESSKTSRHYRTGHIGPCDNPEFDCHA